MANDYLQALVDSWDNSPFLPDFDFYSMIELNAYFRKRIEIIKRSSPRYPYLRKGEHYVIIVEKLSEKEVQLVPCSFFTSFSIVFSSSSHYQKRVEKAGVSPQDRPRFFAEVEALLKRDIDRSLGALDRFTAYLDGVHHLDDVPHLTLELLFQSLNDQRILYRAKERSASDDSERFIYRRITRDIVAMQKIISEALLKRKF